MLDARLNIHNYLCLSSNGSSVQIELRSRVAALKERCAASDVVADVAISESAILSANSKEARETGEGRDPREGPELRQLPPQVYQQPQPKTVSMEDYFALRAYTEDVQRELEAAQMELDEVDLEKFELVLARDATPGALLFYASMHDPTTVGALQQLQAELGCLKGFANCSEHVDFMTVKKRIAICVGIAPTLERFLQKYGALHKKWAANRLGQFNRRNLTGGDADNSQACPLCNTDCRPQRRVEMTLQPRGDQRSLASAGWQGKVGNITNSGMRRASKTPASRQSSSVAELPSLSAVGIEELSVAQSSYRTNSHVKIENFNQEESLPPILTGSGRGTRAGNKY